MMPLTLIAQAAGGATQGSPWSFLILMAAFFGIVYFLMILPARRKQKAHDALLKALVPGDRVVTTGGIVGTVTKAENDALRVRIAPSVEITVMRSYIAGKAKEDAP